MKSVFRLLVRKSEKFGVEKTWEGPARHLLLFPHQQDERGPFDRNAKKDRIEIWTFSFQICLCNKFLTSGSCQTENTEIHVFAYF